jgi:hypothetical protein
LHLFLKYATLHLADRLTWFSMDVKIVSKLLKYIGFNIDPILLSESVMCQFEDLAELNLSALIHLRV